MAKINFTAEHMAKFKELAVSSLLNAETFKLSVAGNESNIYDLIHIVSLNSLSNYHTNLKKEISNLEAMDEWSFTEHQQRKLSSFKKAQEIVNLTIGYRRNEAEKEAERVRLSKLKADYKKLKEDTTSPEDKMKSIEAELTAAGVSLE